MKNVQKFTKNLIVPSDLQNILFYARFESGNLFRVVKRPDSSHKTITGLTVLEIERAKNSTIDVEHFDFEYDLYLQPDTNA